MTGIHPIQSVKTTWNNASKAKKAAMVAGAAVATGAVAATVAAVVKGKAPEDAKGISKFGKKLVDGYKQVFAGIKSLPSKIFKKAEKAEEAVAEATEKVEDTVTEAVAEAAEKAE